MEILVLKSTITEMKVSLEELNSIFKLGEERISKTENRSIGIVKSENEREEK